jgi:hypothetical protein
MIRFEYNGNPPYPKYKGYEGILGECWLIIEDTKKVINFRKASLFFEVKYVPNGASIGSIRSYLNNLPNMGNHIFNYIVEFDAPFKLVIEFPDNTDISGLTVKTMKIKRNPEF